MSYSARSKIVPIGTGQNSVSYKFDINDDIRITDSNHYLYDEVGTVQKRYVSQAGYYEYEVKITGMHFWGGHTIEILNESQIVMWTTASSKTRATVPNGYSIAGAWWDEVATVSKPSKIYYCNHSWKEDFNNPFSINKYYSCRSCGKKKEEVDTDDGVPF